MDRDAIETRAMRKCRCQRMVDKSESVTLVDVARVAGVSVKTASRVLNNSSELLPTTAARARSHDETQLSAE
jgi:plasmid maintenance system antidote protein VapI